MVMITNDKGKFVLNLKPNATYTIKISYLGMQNKEIQVTTAAEQTKQLFSKKAELN
jgi:hypothetical protein